MENIIHLLLEFLQAILGDSEMKFNDKFKMKLYVVLFLIDKVVILIAQTCYQFLAMVLSVAEEAIL